MRKVGKGVKYTCKELPTRAVAITAERNPRLTITFIPIIFELLHLVPDIHTAHESPTPSNMSHVVVFWGEMSQRTLPCYNFKGSSNFKHVCLNPNSRK